MGKAKVYNFKMIAICVVSAAVAVPAIAGGYYFLLQAVTLLQN